MLWPIILLNNHIFLQSLQSMYKRHLYFMHFFLVDTSVTHVSHVFHSLMMQTQNLKDVSTTWQVRTKMSSSIFCFTHIARVSGVHGYQRQKLVSNVCLFRALAGPETSLGWLTKALSDFTSEGLKEKTQNPPWHGHSWCWDSEQLSQPGHTLTHTHTHWREDGWIHNHRGWQWNLVSVQRDALMWQSIWWF